MDGVKKGKEMVYLFFSPQPVFSQHHLLNSKFVSINFCVTVVIF